MRSRVLTFGEGLGVLRTSEPGSLAQLPVLLVGTGGAENNVAIGLARLGVDVCWLGRVGADSLGRRVLRELRAEGVSVTGIIDSGAPTGLLIKESRYPGATEVTYYRSASAGSGLRPADLDATEFRADDILHVTGVTAALSDSARATIDEAIRRASAAESLISYDVNHRSRLWSDESAIPTHRAILARAQLAFASHDEAALLLGVDPAGDSETLARQLATLGPSEVVITRGDLGALTFRDGEVTEQAAVDLKTVVDTVGAGDAFVAGYLAELMGGGSVRDRLLLAVQNGAAACLSPGDWEGSGTREELRRRAGEGDADPVRR